MTAVFSGDLHRQFPTPPQAKPSPPSHLIEYEHVCVCVCACLRTRLFVIKQLIVPVLD